MALKEHTNYFTRKNNMIYISHRGNLNGIVAGRENSLDYIQEALDYGVDVEIDLRMKNNEPYLGHDEAQYLISKEWLNFRKNKLWIHVKEYQALVWLMNNIPDAMYFCHESDRYTLTSNGYIWSHDLSNNMTDKCIIPLLDLNSVNSYNKIDFYAVCSDFILDCKEKFK